jgi:hypothetical protein
LAWITTKKYLKNLHQSSSNGSSWLIIVSTIWPYLCKQLN